jgi:DNA replication protein DnaC
MRECCAGQRPWPLVLIGRPGVGKTCAALALLDWATGLYDTAAGLPDKVLLANKGELWNPQTQQRVSPAALWEDLTRRSALVVLDELGARERVSDWAYQCVYRAVDERSGRPLILGSNLGLEALTGLYDYRLTSRLAAGTVLEMTGPDRRLVRR